MDGFSPHLNRRLGDCCSDVFGILEEIFHIGRAIHTVNIGFAVESLFFNGGQGPDSTLIVEGHNHVKLDALLDDRTHYRHRNLCLPLGFPPRNNTVLGMGRNGVQKTFNPIDSRKGVRMLQKENVSPRESRHHVPGIQDTSLIVVRNNGDIRHLVVFELTVDHHDVDSLLTGFFQGLPNILAPAIHGVDDHKVDILFDKGLNLLALLLHAEGRIPGIEDISLAIHFLLNLSVDNLVKIIVHGHVAGSNLPLTGHHGDHLVLDIDAKDQQKSKKQAETIADIYSPKHGSPYKYVSNTWAMPS